MDDFRYIDTFGAIAEASGRLEAELNRELQEEVGMPLAWLEVLLRISRSADQQMTMSELATQITLTSGGTTRLLDRMISAELVERIPCPTDRRVIYAVLASKGKRELGQAIKHHQRSLERLLSPLSTTELTTLQELMRKIKENINSEKSATSS